MTFDPTITAGSLIILGGNLVVFLVFIIRMEGKINILNLRIEHLEIALTALASTEKRLATFEERLASHGSLISTAQQEISALRRGQGFIQNRPQIGVDGEYP